jgi:hypothetical protein
MKLRVPLLNKLRIIFDESDNHWVKLQDFFNSNPASDQAIRKDSILKEISKHKYGVKVIDDIQHINILSVLHYTFHHSEQLAFCKRTVSQVTTLLFENNVDLTCSSLREVCQAVANTDIWNKNTERYFFHEVNLNETNLSDIITTYKADFTS